MRDRCEARSMAEGVHHDDRNREAGPKKKGEKQKYRYCCTSPLSSDIKSPLYFDLMVGIRALTDALYMPQTTQQY